MILRRWCSLWLSRLIAGSLWVSFHLSYCTCSPSVGASFLHFPATIQTHTHTKTNITLIGNLRKWYLGHTPGLHGDMQIPQRLLQLMLMLYFNNSAVSCRLSFGSLLRWLWWHSTTQRGFPRTASWNQVSILCSTAAEQEVSARHVHGTVELSVVTCVLNVFLKIFFSFFFRPDPKLEKELRKKFKVDHSHTVYDCWLKNGNERTNIAPWWRAAPEVYCLNEPAFS